MVREVAICECTCMFICGRKVRDDNEQRRRVFLDVGLGLDRGGLVGMKIHHGVYGFFLYILVFLVSFFSFFSFSCRFSFPHWIL